MGLATKAFGLLLIFYAFVAFLVNFDIWRPAHLIAFLAVVWLWNPVGQFVAEKISGNIPVLSSAFAIMIRYIVALIWSAGILIVGAIAVING